jgi:hypothetical protein
VHKAQQQPRARARACVRTFSMNIHDCKPILSNKSIGSCECPIISSFSSLSFVVAGASATTMAAGAVDGGGGGAEAAAGGGGGGVTAAARTVGDAGGGGGGGSCAGGAGAGAGGGAAACGFGGAGGSIYSPGCNTAVEARSDGNLDSSQRAPTSNVEAWIPVSTYCSYVDPYADPKNSLLPSKLYTFFNIA